METLRSDTLHASSSLSCISTRHVDDELSKEKEEELLYGAGDDGDEEDALSDDSLRLRLSDDDELEDVLTSETNNQKIAPQSQKFEPTSALTNDAPNTSTPGNDTKTNDMPGNEVRQEEHCSGNVSLVDKVVNDQEKDTKANKNGLTGLKVASISHCPRPNYESSRRFTNSPRNRLFHNVNRFSYTRHHYSAPSEYYRIESFNYYNRFENRSPQFKRGRGGIYNSYYNDMYGERKERKHSRTFTKSESAASNELNQSSFNRNGLPTNKSNNETTDKQQDMNTGTNKKVEQNNTLDSGRSASMKNNNCSLNESKDRGVEIAKMDDKKTECLNINDDDVPVERNQESKSEKSNEVMKGIPTSNDIVTKDSVDSCNGTSTDASVDKLINTSVKLNNSSKEISVDDQATVSNVKSDNRDFYSSDNSKKMEKFLIKDTEHNPNKDQIVKCIKKDGVSIEKQSEIIAGTAESSMENCEKIVQICQLQQPEDNGKKAASGNECNDTANDDLSVNDSRKSPDEPSRIASPRLNEAKKTNDDVTAPDCEVVDQVVKESSEKGEDHSRKNNSSNKDNETNMAIADVSEDLPDNDDKTETSKRNLTSESIGESEKCEKRRVDNDCDVVSINSIKVIELLTPEDESLDSDNNIQKNEKDEQSSNNANLPDVHSVNKELVKIQETTCELETNKSTNPALKNNNENGVNDNCRLTDKNDETATDTLLDLNTDTKGNDNDIKKNDTEAPVTTQKRRRRTKKMIAAAQEAASEENKQVREVGRQKRKTAKNAEEIIRKKFLNHDSDLESSDGSEKFVIVNHKRNQDARSLSPPSLKRNYPDTDTVTVNGSVKKIKVNSEVESCRVAENECSAENVKKLDFVHQFFQRNLEEALPKLKQEELEELLIQKIVETITMRGEIGKLREQARISEKNQEAMRARCQQLAKQIKDFEMVLNRNAADRRANNDKPTAPIKINRSVGLQVNFMTDHGMQNLRQIQQNSTIKSLNVSNGGNTSNTETNSNATSPRRGIKVRSPRRSEIPTGVQPAVVSQNPAQSSPVISTITPTALVVSKPADSQHTLALPNQPSGAQQLLPNQQVQSQQPQQTIVLNGKLPNQVNRQASPANIQKSRTNDLIDLTDEEEKSKAAINIPVVTAAITDQQINIAPKTQPRFQRVIQTIPTNVAITTQPTSIRVVQPASQPTPTALVNNMNAPRLAAYVMQSTVGPTRQLLIAPNTSQMRPVTSCNRTSFSTLTYKTGISTVANGTVRVLTTPASTNVQINKHPAPLPDTRNYAVNPSWKLPPPAPSLKISKVANGIVLSWNMNLSDKYADIASYQLYAYQEVAGIPPNTTLWKKVGDVRALPLPMACTLTQFSEGNNYYFAVRAVDTHSRKGQYSIPGNISL